MGSIPDVAGTPITLTPWTCGGVAFLNFDISFLHRLSAYILKAV